MFCVRPSWPRFLSFVLASLLLEAVGARLQAEDVQTNLAAETATQTFVTTSNPLTSPPLTAFYSFVKSAPARLGATLGVPPWADAMTRGQAAYGRGDYGAARADFETASAQGDIIATWYLGHTYRIGDARAGVEANPRQAFAMYNTAASFGHPAAHYALGLMSMAGLGVKQNVDQGMKWLMLAARKRYAPAEAALGDLFWKGEVVPRDRIRGIMWYMLAEQTAGPERHPEIMDRLDGLIAEASDPERLEAQTRARLWAERYPVGGMATAVLTAD